MSSTGLVYRTPEAIRAIPNDQWEAWLSTEAVPWPAFSAESRCQMTLRYVVKATARRLAVRR